jgi:hypothetical protein
MRNHGSELRIVGCRFRLSAAKFFGMMVARDGVEPPVGIEPSEVADSTRDIRGGSDYLDIFPARIQYTDSMKF